MLAVFEDTGVPGPRLEKLPGLGEALGSLAEEGAGVLRAVKRDLVASDVVVGAVDERLVGCVDARVLAADGTGKVTRIISHW